MRVLLLAHAFNGLTQRLFVELAEDGHEVSVELDVHDEATEEAVRLFRPDLVLAPFLKRRIPESVWGTRPTLVLHPGPPGDRGPSALDRAILDGVAEGGVTLLEARSGLDAGPVRAEARFPMRAATKSSLYRHEVAEAAVRVVKGALDGRPAPARPVVGAWRGLVSRTERAIDWRRHGTAEALARIRSGDSHPGVLDEILGLRVRLHDACEEPVLRGEPGAMIARHRDAVCRATADGAIWIGHLREEVEGDEVSPKLPAADVLGSRLAGIPEVATGGPSEIEYRERSGVGYLSFAFLDGAMSAGRCERLRVAYREALRRPTRVLVLLGGPDFWSNGIHLGVIEAAESPADESWRNILAIDDLALEILTTLDRVTIAALQGNAAAGGVFLALAADVVLARSGVILNPHYRGMGNLHGSEYWTYTLPRRAGSGGAAEFSGSRLPMGVPEARRRGLVDLAFDGDVRAFRLEVAAHAEALARDPSLETLLEEKRRRRAADEAARPLAEYRREELERMRLAFYGFDPSYHIARYRFVRKVPKSRTPSWLARHRNEERTP